jgi:CBS domain-containing protein
LNSGASAGAKADISADLALNDRQYEDAKMSVMSQPEPSRTTKTTEHPDGSMYRFLECTAGQYMTHAVVTVTRQLTLEDLVRLFEKHDFNSFPVVEQGKMLGIVTKFDFLKAFAFTTGQMVPHYDELMNRQVLVMMTEAVVHVEPTTPLTRVLEMMVSLKARSFPVIGPGRELLGMISREDVMRALREAKSGADGPASSR